MEELLAEHGIAVDHVTIYRWVQLPIYQRQTAAYGGIWLHEPVSPGGRRWVRTNVG